MLLSRRFAPQLTTDKSRVLHAHLLGNRAVVVRSLYNFADVETKEFGRRNKAYMRKEGASCMCEAYGFWPEHWVVHVAC